MSSLASMDHFFVKKNYENLEKNCRKTNLDFFAICIWGLDLYTRRQINQDRMIFGDFSVNSEPIFFKFYKGNFLFKS